MTSGTQFGGTPGPVSSLKAYGLFCDYKFSLQWWTTIYTSTYEHGYWITHLSEGGGIKFDLKTNFERCFFNFKPLKQNISMI